MTNIRVLVAERYPLMRSGIACLSDEKSDVTIVAEAKSAEQTLALAGKTLPNVVLLDAHLPAASCAEVVRQLRDQERLTEIIVMTEPRKETEVFDMTNVTPPP